MGRFLVTGAAGFIGSRVAQALLAERNEVVGVDNLNDAYDVRLKEWRLHRLEPQAGFRFVRADLSDARALDAVFARGGPEPPFAAVINLATRAGVRASIEIPEVYFDTNVAGTLRLLEQCRRTGVEKFVLASSSSLYGESTDLPYREDSDTDRPISPYAASKKSAEVLCHAYHRIHGIDVTVFRYFTVYGPAGRPDMSPFRFVQWISEGRPLTLYGDGSQSRDFTYIDDIVSGTVAGLRPVGYRVVNLGSDRPVAINDVISLVERLTGKKARIVTKPPHPADVPATWADISRARDCLGWSPRVGLEDGFREVVSWYRQNQSWASGVVTDG